MKLAKLFILAIAGGALSSCGGESDELTPAKLQTKSSITSFFSHALERTGAMASRGGSRLVRDHDEGHFFDEAIGLWVRAIEPNMEDPAAPSGEEYTEDPEGLIPAGHAFTWYSDGAVFPNVLRTERIILAGPMAGANDTLRIETNEDTSWAMTATSVIPLEGSFEYTASFDVRARGSYSGKFTYLDESWEKYTATRLDQGGVATFESSTGLKVTLNFREDTSGEGTITGEGEGLPATVQWDSTGKGLITWSDGSTTEVDIAPFFESDPVE
jgi:hypothetical protein